jgi:hypothetical protein
MHVPINVKSPNNISKWQMGFNSAFKGLIIFFHLCLGLQVSFITLDFPTKMLYVPLSPFPCRRHMPCSFILLHLIGRAMFRENTTVKTFIIRFSLFSYQSSFFGPNIFFSALYANNAGNGGPRPNPEKNTHGYVQSVPNCGSLHN